MLIIHCDGGLANRINCLANGLLIAQLWQVDYELVWPINRYCRASASDLLELDEQPVDRSKNEYILAENTGIIASDNFLSIEAGLYLNPSTCKSRSEFARKASMLLTICSKVIVFYPSPLPQFYFDVKRVAKSFKFKSSILLYSAKEQRRLALKPFLYWGLHLRGTDVRKANWYYSFFVRLSRILPGNLLVLSDDSQIIKAFSTQTVTVKTRQGIPLVDIYDQSLEWNASSIDENGQQLPYNVNRSRESVKEALVDLMLLSQSMPIPTSTSTFLELSLFLNPIYGSVISYLFYLRSKLNLIRSRVNLR